MRLPVVLSNRLCVVIVNIGRRAGIPTEMAEKMKALERENRELRQGPMPRSVLVFPPLVSDGVSCQDLPLPHLTFPPRPAVIHSSDMCHRAALTRDNIASGFKHLAILAPIPTAGAKIIQVFEDDGETLSDSGFWLSV